MTYLFLLYQDSTRPAPTPESMIATIDLHHEIMADAKNQGVYLGGSPVTGPEKAMQVRSKPDGSSVVTDGPFAETKEQLAGYYMLECPSAEVAQQWAARIARTNCANVVEVRALRAMPTRESYEVLLGAATATAHA